MKKAESAPAATVTGGKKKGSESDEEKTPKDPKPAVIPPGAIVSLDEWDLQVVAEGSKRLVVGGVEHFITDASGNFLTPMVNVSSLVSKITRLRTMGPKSPYERIVEHFKDKINDVVLICTAHITYGGKNLKPINSAPGILDIIRAEEDNGVARNYHEKKQIGVELGLRFVREDIAVAFAVVTMQVSKALNKGSVALPAAFMWNGAGHVIGGMWKKYRSPYRNWRKVKDSSIKNAPNAAGAASSTAAAVVGPPVKVPDLDERLDREFDNQVINEDMRTDLDPYLK